MEQQIEQSTTDAFDAAITAESTAPDQTPVEADAPSSARDDKGRFAAKPVEQVGEAEVEQKATTEKPAEKKPRNDPQARIDQAIARQRDAERRAEDAERRAREIESRQAPKQDAPKPAAQPDRFPRFDEWSAKNPTSTHDDYLDARDEWRDAATASKQREAFEESQRHQSFEKRATTFSERYAAAREADPDVATRIEPSLLTAKPLSTLTKKEKALISAIPDPRTREDFVFKCFLADRWIDSEHAVGVLEHLSDAKTFQRLATLPPDQVIEELARVKAGFAAASDKESRGSAPKPSASQAHPPIKPLGSAPRVPDADDGSEDEPLETFIRRENAKERKAGRLG